MKKNLENKGLDFLMKSYHFNKKDLKTLGKISELAKDKNVAGVEISDHLHPIEDGFIPVYIKLNNKLNNEKLISLLDNYNLWKERTNEPKSDVVCNDPRDYFIYNLLINVGNE